MPSLGSSVICGFNPGGPSKDTVNRYRWPTAANRMAASVRANVLPMQTRGPPPNG